MMIRCTCCGQKVSEMDWNAGIHDCPATPEWRDGETWEEYKRRSDALIEEYQRKHGIKTK